MGMSGQTKNMRRFYEQSEWIEQKRRDRQAMMIFLFSLFVIVASMVALCSFLLFTLL